MMMQLMVNELKTERESFFIDVLASHAKRAEYTVEYTNAPRIRPCAYAGRGNSELDLRDRAIGVVRGEILGRLEVEHAGDDVRGHLHDAVVVLEHGVVVELAAIGDLIFKAGEASLQVEEVLVRLEVGYASTIARRFTIALVSACSAAARCSSVEFGLFATSTTPARAFVTCSNTVDSCVAYLSRPPRDSE